MLLRTAICDDDVNDAEHILSFLKQYEIEYDVDFEVLVFHSPEDMLCSYSERGTFQLVFLDVEMPKMNGIQLAQAIRDLNDMEVRIVFVSNYPRYMQDSFPVHPVHFLTKPLAFHEFKKVISQILKEIESSCIYKTLIKADGEEELINIHDIFYIEVLKGKKDKLAFHMKDNYIETVGILKYWEEKLRNHHFVSSYRGTLVNLKCIHFIKEDKIILINGERLPLSRRKSAELHKLLSRCIIVFEHE